MTMYVSLHDARRIMNGNFIEQHRSPSPDRVSFSAEVLTKARELEYRLVFVPEGTLNTLGRRMSMFLDKLSFESGSILMQDGGPSWCLIKVSDGRAHVPIDLHAVEVMRVREVVFASYAYMSERFASLFQGEALALDGMSQEMVLTQTAGNVSVLPLLGRRNTEHFRRMVGVRSFLNE